MHVLIVVCKGCVFVNCHYLFLLLLNREMHMIIVSLFVASSIRLLEC